MSLESLKWDAPSSSRRPDARALITFRRTNRLWLMPMDSCGRCSQGRGCHKGVGAAREGGGGGRRAYIILPCQHQLHEYLPSVLFLLRASEKHAHCGVDKREGGGNKKASG